MWFEAHAQPAIPDNHGYLRRHLTGDRGRLPLWVQGGCGDGCWVPGLPRDDVHVYATWLFFWSAADEQRRPRAGAPPADAASPPPARATTSASRRCGRRPAATSPVRLREYGLSLLGRRRIGAQPGAAGGRCRAGARGAGARRRADAARRALAAAAPVRRPSRRWPGRRSVVVRTSPAPATLLRRGLALVLADGRVLRLPRQVDDTLVFDVPPASGGGTLVLTSTRAVWPLAYRVELRPVQRPAAGGDGTA